jgi:maltose O-acetyltransferase
LILAKIWNKLKLIGFMWVFSVVFNREGLRVGENSGWGVGCFINAGGGVTIGNNVLIGPKVVIHSLNHVYRDAGVLIRFQGHVAKPVVIEDDVWIGAGAVILPGVRVGRGAVVGAGSVVTKDVPAFGVVVGNPARFVRFRGVEKA